MNKLTQMEIKSKMNDWVSMEIAESRSEGKRLTRAMISRKLGVAESSFSQYLNPKHPKNATWEFQTKLAAIMNKSLRELHPELIDLSLALEG